MAGLSVPLDEVVHFDADTNSTTTGGESNADSTPVFRVYEEDNDTAILGPTNMTLRTGLTGGYRGTFTASAANGFEVGKWYIVKAFGTVGGVTGKATVLIFRLTPAESSAGVPKVDLSHWLGTAAATPTTAGVPEVDVTYIGGDAQSATDLKDFADAGYDPATNKVQGVVLVDTATTLTNLPAITANWLTAAGLAADAVTEIQSGLSTLDAAGIRTAVGLASANLDTQLADLPTVAEFEARTLVAANYFDPAADTVANVTTVGSVTTKTGYALTSDYDFAKGTVAVTEAYAADGAAPTPVQSLMLIQQALTEVSISSTTMTIKKLDGSTTAATLTLNDASTPTSKTRAT
jgi:hypothetical protein